MDVWAWLIFGVAAVVALRVLAGLMTAERYRLLAEAAAKEAAERARVAAEAEARQAAQKRKGGDRRQAA